VINVDLEQEYKINIKIGKARIMTRWGIFCECGNKLSDADEKCSNCNE
jgi:hypothetical protein